MSDINLLRVIFTLMNDSELKILAKYPFMKKSKEYVDSLGLNIDNLKENPVYSASIGMAQERILNSLRGNFKPNLEDALSMELTLISYPIARIVINLIGNNNIIKEYASSEVETIYDSLREEDPEILESIMLDLNLKITENRISLIDYIHLTSGLSVYEKKWKLINRRVNHGYVEITEGEILYLLKEAIRLKIIEPVEIKNVPNYLKGISQNLKSILIGTEKQVKIGQLNKSALPPCINSLLVVLQSGEISHNGMFILATFVTNLGMETDKIVEIFSVFPKFDEKKTRYQLGFLTGERGSTKYTCPTCVTIKSYGLCRWDCKVKHPLQYYRRHSK